MGLSRVLFREASLDRVSVGGGRETCSESVSPSSHIQAGILSHGVE